MHFKIVFGRHSITERVFHQFMHSWPISWKDFAR